MITRIKKLKTLGVFADFAWDTGLHTFGRYNLIYGWNGSGKTTLSRLFAGLQAGLVLGHPNSEYEIELADGTIVKAGQPFSAKVRVFNRDYVANNVHTISGKAKPILILGEENKKVADEIEADEAALAAKRNQVEKLNQEFQTAVARKDKIFSEIAKTIGLNTSGLATRNYRRPDAEKDYAALESNTLLSDDAVAANALELKQLEKPHVSEIVMTSLAVDTEEQSLPDFLDAILAMARRLCSQTVESKLVERLRQYQDLARWVEDGLGLHKIYASEECEFCGQSLPSDRMRILTAHFNEADRKLKSEIDDLLRLLAEAERAVRGLHSPDKANLYDELQEGYQAAVDQFSIAKTALLDQVHLLSASMEAKKAKTTEAITLNAGLNVVGIIADLDAVNAEIKKHNTKTANFKLRKDVARKKLETHYLGTIYDEVKGLEKKLADTKSEIVRVQSGGSPTPEATSIIGLSERIKINRAKISSSHKGCQEINSALKTFLGRDELQFEVDAEGYVLMRGKKLAENLSEGERTAIGFVYFTIHLKDQNFNLANGIIMIDDPVSSLDSNSMFQAFAFLKNSVKDAEQVFLMTHNFDFLQLLINWIRSSKTKSSYYMIKSTYTTSGDRVASLTALDKLLEKHESEYHYLFKLLYTFKSDGTIESVYNMPNIARKVLDTFLMFRVPSGESSYKKLESLKLHFDENKLTAIYKFTNDQSHITGKGFDPSLVAETQNNVKYLLEMVEAVFPEHYKILVESISV